MFPHEWRKRPRILFNLPNIQLRIVLAHTAKLAYELISLLNCFKVAVNKHFLTTEKNYCNSGAAQEIKWGHTIHPSPTSSTSHSIALKMGMSSIHTVKLVY